MSKRSIEGRRNKCTFKYEITKSNVLSWDDPVWLTGRASYRESKGPEFEPSPRKKKVFLLELLLIRQWGSLAGPCNPMRLGHDGCTLVRSEVSCIRKGKNEAIQGWISHLSLERQAFYSLPFPPLLATSTGIDGGGVTGGVVLHSTLSFPPSFRHRSLKDHPTVGVSGLTRTG